MNTFGILKNKILRKLTDVYTERNMSEVKKIMSLLKENKDIKNMYLFYEDFENKYMEDKNLAEMYVNEISIMLGKEGLNLLPKVKKLIKELGDVETEPNTLYENIDTLLTEDTLFNIDKKITSKKFLVEYLTTKKLEPIEENVDSYTTNETLLYTLLSNNFNVLFENTLSDDEKKELKDIINLSNEELKLKVLDLKETVLNKIENLLIENVDVEINMKLENVKKEVGLMRETKYNLYRLKELEMGL